jgi:hypothetical protein
MHKIPPTYLSSVAIPTSGTGPATLLADGAWCGHGEPSFGVYDIRTPDSTLFSLRLPSSPTFPELAAVTAVSSSRQTFFLYDPRKHPASVYADDRRDFPYTPAPPFSCPSCRAEAFSVAVGFEVPSDSEEPDDVSWFAVAVECSQCKWRGIIFDDETA